MSQFATFALPASSDGTSEDALSAFLRGHRVVSVERVYDPGRGCWSFCVEWLDGGAGDGRG